ncbi:cell division protein SepF [Kitasatospora sp. CM 4170]|uniref:Cell division protein SepF n=1 Tax=Kitasatospora aburaviensis TaxID=67265 RepID=A0ABW1ER04_9ACTN|nr:MULTISPECIES: cell division protein SepF [unclassified Kitasatospora]MCG6493151.1 cell division protein SepF [Kitasatospora sp. A2-31]WNM45334.1 cell division protein SepF [Kitasatospora sp. CM 4170]
MAGAMRKMAVYLGLVEDETYDGQGYDPDDDYDADPEPIRAGRTEDIPRPAAPAPAPVSSITPQPVPAAVPIRQEAPRMAPVSSITPERRHNLEKSAPVIMPKVVNEREPYRITTLHPRTYNEARTIGEQFRGGTPVIMNLTEMDDTDAKRLVDFAAGLVFGLHGSIERVTQKVFLLSPANVDVTAEDKARIAEGGFFNQS